MTDLTRNIRSVAKQGNNIKAVVIAVSGERATVRLATNGAIYRTLKVVGGPVIVGQSVQVDFSTDIPYIIAIGTSQEVEEFNYKARIPKYPTYVRSAVAGAEYAIIHYDMSAQQMYNYSVDFSGLSNALSVAAAGDTVFVPPCNISCAGDLQVNENVTLLGLDRDNCIINGAQFTLCSNSVIQNIKINVITSGSAAVYGVKTTRTSIDLSDEERSKILFCDINATSIGGNAYGVLIQGSTVIHYSSISGSSVEDVETSGSGYGLYNIGDPQSVGISNYLWHSYNGGATVSDTDPTVYNPYAPLGKTLEGDVGGPDTFYCSIIDDGIADNAWVTYDLNGIYFIHHLWMYAKTIGDLFVKGSTNGTDWFTIQHSRISWVEGDWGYGDYFGASDYYARFIRFEEDAFPLIGDRTLLGYFDLLLDIEGTTRTVYNCEFCWSHIDGSHYSIYGLAGVNLLDISGDGDSVPPFSVYASQYNTLKTEGSIALLDGDVRRYSSTHGSVNISAQVPSIDAHYDVPAPIDETSIAIYKNGLRQNPALIIVDSDGMGFTTLFDLQAGDELIVDYSSTIDSAKEYTALFYCDGLLDIGLQRMRIYNTSNRSKKIIKVFIAVGSYSTNGEVVVDIHKDGTTIFTNQNHRPYIYAVNDHGETTQIDVSDWLPGECLQMAIDNAGTNAAHLSVHVVYQ